MDFLYGLGEEPLILVAEVLRHVNGLVDCGRGAVADTISEVDQQLAHVGVGEGVGVVVEALADFGADIEGGQQHSLAKVRLLDLVVLSVEREELLEGGVFVKVVDGAGVEAGNSAGVSHRHAGGKDAGQRVVGVAEALERGRALRGQSEAGEVLRLELPVDAQYQACIYTAGVRRAKNLRHSLSQSTLPASLGESQPEVKGNPGAATKCRIPLLRPCPA